MKKICIFLGSSIEDLHEERQSLGSFITGLNNKYIDKGVYINFYVCEETSGAMALEGSQSVHDKYITDEADATFFMFFRKAGQYTLHELELARNTFLSNSDKPNVFVYFKNIYGDDIPEEVEKAVDKVANEYGHYYKSFDHVDTVKLEMLKFVTDMLDGQSDLLIKDGKVLLNGEQIPDINVDGILAYQNNAQLKGLKEKVDDLKNKMENALKDDDDVSFLKYSKELNETKEEYNKLESDIFKSLILFFEENRKGKKANPIRQKALKLLEEGNPKEAIALLPTAEQNKASADAIINESKLTKEKNRVEAEDIIANAKTAISILITDIEDKDRFIKIEEQYDAVCNLAEDYDLDLLYEFVVYLNQQKKYSKAISIAERLEYICRNPGYRDDYKKASVFNVLAALYSDTNQFGKAEKLYKEALDIRRKLAEENPDAYLFYVAGTCYNLIFLYRYTKQFGEAEKLYKEALDVYRKLAEENPDAYLYDVAGTCDDLANLYRHTNQYEEAEKLYKEALDVYRKLAEENPDAFLPDVAMTCNNLARFYYQTSKFGEAEKLYKEALDIRRKLAEANPDAFLPDVATTCNNLANLYSDTKQLGEAEKLYKEALDIRRKLAEEDPDWFDWFLPNVANTCNNLANLYYQTNKFGEAEKLYKEALDIRRKLAEENPDAYLSNVAMTCNNLANLYKNTNRFEEAEKLYKEALNVYHKLAEENPDAYLSYVALVCENLAELYEKTNRPDEAKKLYEEAKEIEEKLKGENG